MKLLYSIIEILIFSVASSLFAYFFVLGTVFIYDLIDHNFNPTKEFVCKKYGKAKFHLRIIRILLIIITVQLSLLYIVRWAKAPFILDQINWDRVLGRER